MNQPIFSTWMNHNRKAHIKSCNSGGCLLFFVGHLLFGWAAGSGMSVLILLGGILVVAVSLGAYQNKLIHEIKILIPERNEGGLN